MEGRPGSVLEMIARFENDPGDAVVCGRERISYRQLVADYRSFAGELSRFGIKKGDTVVQRSRRGIGYVTSMLGILTAGGVCVQMDPEWPEARIQEILDDSGARMQVADGRILDDSGARLQGMDEPAAGKDAKDALPAIRPDDPCMVFYTSGSTGSPKGSVLTHGMLCAPVIACEQNVMAAGAALCRNILTILNFSYCFAMKDLFIALCGGKRVIIATQEERADAGRLGILMNRWKVDMMSATPSLLRSFLTDPVFAEAAGELKQLCLSGEILPEKLEKMICRTMKGAVYDGYGSSEMFHLGDRRCRSDRTSSAFVPTLGVVFYVFRDLAAFEEAAPGEEGELLIGSERAQHGRYLNRKELNSEKYVQHPVYGRLFRTGDRAILTTGGALNLRGRKDGMLKLRGQRLEAQEIELLIAGFPGITQGAVKLQGGKENAQLVAFYTAAEEIDPFALREWLSTKLPHYMIPVRFARLASLPVNANGKLDRQALPDIPESRENARYIEAPNKVQRLICSLFQRILKTDRPVGNMDNFFELGGDSIKGMQIVSLLRQKGYALRLSDLFTWPTAARLSGMVRKETDFGEVPEDGYDRGILDRLDEEEKGAVSAVASMENVEAVYPFLPSMKNRLYAAKDKAWFTASLVYIRHPVDEKQLAARFKELASKRQMLRSLVICQEQVQPMTVVLKASPGRLFSMDLRWMRPDEKRQKQHIRSFVQAFRTEGFDPSSPAFLAGLIRLDEDRQMLLILYSHYLLDGMSIQRIFGELTGNGELATDAQDVSLYYHRWEAAAVSPAVSAHWEKLLGSRKGYTLLAAESGTVRERKERRIKTRRFFLPMKPVAQYCRNHQVTPAAWIHAVLGEALVKLTGREEVLFASMCSGRDESLTKDASLTGNYAAELPFLHRHGELPADCQKQLLAGSAFCMYEFSRAGSKGGEGWRQPGYVRCDILNYPLANGIDPDDFTLAEDHYTRVQGDYMKELEMFFVLADGIYATWFYSGEFICETDASDLEALFKIFAKQYYE